MFSYLFTENALADIVKQAVYYSEVQEGLGIKFMNEITTTAELISLMPLSFASQYKSYRELKTKKYPFKLIYTLEGNIIYIHAVYPCKANPKRKYKKIKK